MQSSEEQRTSEQSHTFVERFKEGINTVSSSISGTAQQLREKIWPLERPNPEKDLSPEVKQQNEKVFAEISKLPHKKEKVIETEGSASDEQVKGFLTRAKEGVSGISEKLQHSIENLAGKFTHPTDKPTSVSTSETDAPSGFVEYAPTEKVSKSDLKEFTEVKEGFSQTIPELQQERKEGQPKLASNNPFDLLSGENASLDQLSGNADVVGGHLSTQVGTDSTNRPVEPTHEKTLTEKAKGTFTGATAKISGSINEAKGKLLSAFGNEGKENISS